MAGTWKGKIKCKGCGKTITIGLKIDRRLGLKVDPTGMTRVCPECGHHNVVDKKDLLYSQE